MMGDRMVYDFASHRIGDKVVVGAGFKWHRMNHPDDRIIAVDDNVGHGGRQTTLPSSVIFAGLIDEAVPSVPADAKPLLFGDVWHMVPWLAERGCFPSIQVDEKLAHSLIGRYPFLGEPFLCVHILQDAPYNRCRNHSCDCMRALIERLAAAGIPVVRIGVYNGDLIAGCHDLTGEGLSIMGSACVIRRAAAYVGGDTGMSHIAGAVGVPWILAIYGEDDRDHGGPDRHRMQWGAAWCCSRPYGATSRVSVMHMKDHQFDVEDAVRRCLGWWCNVRARMPGGRKPRRAGRVKSAMRAGTPAPQRAGRMPAVQQAGEAVGVQSAGGTPAPR